MSLTSTERTGIVSLSVIMFNAAPGARYLGELTSLFEANGRSLAQLGKALSATPVYQAISPSYQTATEFATQFLTPLNLQANAEAIAYVTSRINAGQTKGEVAAEAAAALAGYTGNNAALLAAKATLANKTTVAENYTVVLGAGGDNLAALQAAIAGVTSDASSVAAAITANKTGGLNPGQLLNFTLNGFNANGVLAADSLAGTAGNDLFLARIFNNANTFQSGDKASGGAGLDRLEADIGTSQAFAITAETSSIEEVSIRAQAEQGDSGQNNTAGRVQIDAQRMVGVNQWESNNSRADVLIEDVRIQASQITKDITIAMIETDPGNVDLGVYFDQYSLRNSTSSTSQLNLKIMDTVAASNAATAATPLLNSNYGSFTFSTTIAGTTNVVTLASQAIQDAQTYVQLKDAFQAALDALFGVGAATATIGADFTVTDPVSNKAVTGQTIVLKANTAIAFTTPAGSGWAADGVSPPTSNLYTDFNTDSTTASSLVTSKIILDDVGRGSTGGDLVVGGLSVGTTSTSKGVERFEIEVRDNSKLQVISSTNNTLREVTVVNGVTSSSSFAYVNTAVNSGDLSVLGNDGVIGTGTPIPGFPVDAALPGTALENNAFGFTDVRLIDASAMSGNFAFDAQVTSASIAKYMNLRDVQAGPAVDNIAFVYTGGANDDTMFTTLDSAVVGSRSTIVSGREDMTFTANGGAGNDAITVNVAGPNGGLNGGAQAWYTNQKLNANIFVNGGDGNDTIRTPGAGDVKIDAGAGDDTVYTDNTGALAAAPNATGAATAAAIAYTNAAAAELAAAQAAAVASNITGFGRVSGTEAAGSAFVTPAAAAAALNTLNLATPATYDVLTAPTYAGIQVAINAAVASGGLTFAQASDLSLAYKAWTTAGVVTPQTTLADQVMTAGTASATPAVALSAADFAAGNALLDTYVAAAKSAAAVASSNDTNAPVHAALLDATQLAVLNATQAVNKVFDPAAAAVSGLTFTVGVITQGANEFATFTPAVLAAGNTVVINGLTITAGGAGATAANVETALETSTTTGGATVTGVYTGAWTVGAGAVGTVVYTSTATGNPADLANTGNVVNAPVTTVAAAEVVPVTITGTGLAGETVTFDGVTHAVAGLSGTAVAALINAEATDTTFTDTDNGAGLLTLTAVTAGVRADVTAGSFASNNLNAAAGTQTTVNNLAALSTALVTGATDAAVVTALQTAIDNGAITSAQATALFGAAVGTAGTIDATELLNLQAILVPIQTTAANANTTAQATLTAALAADLAIQNANAAAAATTPAGNGVITGNDAIGSADTAVAQANAQTALTAANVVVTAANTAAANLAALKAAIAVGSTDLAVVTATTNAVANGSITAGNKTAIDAAATAVTGTVGVPVTAPEKIAVDVLITALQVANDILVADATLDAANLGAILTATTTANTIATAAAASGANALTLASPKAVYVFNTANQTAGYNRLTQDERNLADLKSGANDSYNFFNTTVKVSFKGLDASVVLAGTGFKTTNLEINQAIKLAINSDPVLSKLLLATDGPANSLVVTSLIDGQQALTNLAVTVTLPTTVTAGDLAGAITAHGLAAGTTEAGLLAAMTTVKTGFDTGATGGDYVTQWAESGAAGGNTNLVGANSLSSSDNTVTPGAGKDVIVLGTTVGTDALTSSNEKVVYNTDFGNDTIVFFAATGLGIDTLDLTALKGSGAVAFGSLALDKSIVVQADTVVPQTAAQIAALFTDSATAINHVYIAYNAANVGSVYQITDAAGVAAGNVTATLMGTIDLADTAWASLTAANFA